MIKYSPVKLQFATINTEFNRLSDDMKGVHTHPGTAIKLSVPSGKSGKS